MNLRVLGSSLTVRLSLIEVTALKLVEVYALQLVTMNL